MKFCHMVISQYTVRCSYNTAYAYGTAVTKAEHKSEVTITKDTPYLTLTGDLWGVYCEHIRENLKAL